MRSSCATGGTRNWCGGMDGTDDFLILMGAADREHLGEARADHFGLLPQTASDDHPAIFGERFADGLKRFFFGRIEKTARVDQHDVGTRIVARHRIAVGAQHR